MHPTGCSLTYARSDLSAAIYDEKVVLSSYPQAIPPGCYQYRFQWQLPPKLPGSFNLQDNKNRYGSRRNIMATIEYRLTATVTPRAPCGVTVEA